MLKSSKLASVLVALAILLMACTPASRVEETPSPFIIYDIGKPVTHATHVNYHIENPIDIIRKESTNGNWFQIDGLKDKSVQDSVNAQIRQLADDLSAFSHMKKMYPYPGSALLWDQDTKPLYQYYSVTVSYNRQNILSVRGDASFSAKGIDGQFYSLNHTQGITFDLNSGKPIALTQMFIDSADALGTLNDAIVKEINRPLDPYWGYDGSYLSLIRPFTGITPSQNYCLSEFGLYLFFDHSNAFFETPNGTITSYIPLPQLIDHLAINDKFMLDTPLYEKTPYKKFFISHERADSISEYSNTEVDGIHFSRTLDDASGTLWAIYGEPMRSQALSDIDPLILEKISWIEEFNRVSLIGPFINVSIDFWFGYNEGNNYQSYSYQRSLMLNSELKAVALEDIFAPGYDYESMLIKRIKGELAASSGIWDDEVAASLLEGLSFETTPYGIIFRGGTLSHNQDINQTLYIYLDYDTIGYENLRLFD